MATKNDQLQSAWRAYEKEHGYIPASAREACVWAVMRGIIQMPEIDPFDQLAEDMSRALREEYGTDALGRRFRKNHAVRVTKGGVQHTMWAIMGNAPREHMHKAFIQRREEALKNRQPVPQLPGAGIFASPPSGQVASIRSEARLEDGTVYVRDAVALLRPVPRRPVTYLAWRAAHTPEPKPEATAPEETAAKK